MISKALLGIQEDRQWALRRGLEEINKEIEAASRSGVASCWFPMGTRNERIIRLAAKEASLLNSRQGHVVSMPCMRSQLLKTFVVCSCGMSMITVQQSLLYMFSLPPE